MVLSDATGHVSPAFQSALTPNLICFRAPTGGSKANDFAVVMKRTCGYSHPHSVVFSQSGL